MTRNFLAGRDPAPIDELNRGLRRWLTAVAGQRVHGTLQQRPLDRFTATERAALVPLPPAPYAPAVWQPATVGRDCSVTFARASYPVPDRLVGQSVLLRGGARTVGVYTADHPLVASHDRATSPGERQTQLAHLPPEKVRGLVISRETCRTQAVAIGPAPLALVEQLFDHRPEDRLRSAGRLLALAQRYSATCLEAACARAAHFGEPGYPTVKRILQEGLDLHPTPEPALPMAAPSARRPGPTFAFVRQAGEFVASLLAAAAVR